MLLRVVFCGVISTVTKSTLQRGMIGQMLSLVSLMVYREVMPFRVGFASIIVHVAQLVLFLTFSAAVVIETGVGDLFDPLVFGAIRCGINALVVGVAMAASFCWHIREVRELRRKREARVQKVEWAYRFSANKFNTTFDAVIASSVPLTHALVLYYAPLVDIEKALRSGI